MTDTIDAIESTCCGRVFRARGDRLTYDPFGELDFIILPSTIRTMTSERDTLLMDTDAGAYRLYRADGTPERDWCIIHERYR